MERLKSAVAGLLLPAGQFTTEELELLVLDETLLLDDTLEFDSAPLGDAPSPPPPPPPQADRIPEKKTTTHPRTTDFI
ncbi:hypothetical protein ACDA63_04645 [Uliginosibacterium sp. sgz301328]|uniref:hypothetical protein n=1 Tax=Uliginosibacterium sp. sgz301328 TaxID=3243764 RepID=UPI00359E6930